MAIALASHSELRGLSSNAVLSPPHLSYKWRREFAKPYLSRDLGSEWADTLMRLLLWREQLILPGRSRVLCQGRVSDASGFHWRPAFSRRRVKVAEVHMPHAGDRADSMETPSAVRLSRRGVSESLS